jgi:hypothetical protein
MRCLLALSVVVAAVLAVGLSLGSATTVPGQVYPSKVLITDTKISIQKDIFTRNGVSRLPRGAVIRYEITNKGTKPYVLRIWHTTSRVMRPGGHDSFLINWNYRGRYLYLTLLRGRPAGPKGWIVIF